MDKIIILDSTFLVKKRLLHSIKEFINSHNKIGDIFIPETVLDEQVKFNMSILETEIIPFLRNYPILYKILDIDYDVSNFSFKLSESDKQKIYVYLRNYIIDLFKGKIIPYKSIELRDVYKRAMRKKAPFNNNSRKEKKNQHQKTSDSGFKDTLIWLSILNYNYDDYSEVIFISNDNDFQHNREKLIKEFFKKHNKPLEMHRNFPDINEDTGKENKDNTKEKETNNNRKIEENSSETLKNYRKVNSYRTDLNKILNEILMKTRPHELGSYSELRFDTNQSININEYNSFKQHIEEVINKNIMMTEIRPKFFLKPYLNEENIREHFKINIQSLINLLILMTEFEKALPDYTDAILSSINSEINETANINYEQGFITDYSNNITVDSEDLPF